MATALLVLTCGSACPPSHTPSLTAATTDRGALTIRGAGWHGCGFVRVSLPSSWGTATALLNAGAFVLEYPVPCGASGEDVARRQATVFAVQKRCDGGSAIRVAATILLPER